MAARTQFDPSKAPDDDKLKELMLYVAWKSQTDPRFGATKLNKILFYADAHFFAQKQRSITGHSYQRNLFGPTLRLYPKMQAQLESEGRARVQTADYCGKSQKRLVPFARPELGRFSADEIALVDEVIEQCWSYTGKDLSDRTHEHPCWRAFRQGDDIPLGAIFVTNRPLTDEEQAHIKRLVPSVRR